MKTVLLLCLALLALIFLGGLFYVIVSTSRTTTNTNATIRTSGNGNQTYITTSSTKDQGQWQKAHVTGYVSWPDQNSDEARNYNGWENRGQFAYIDASGLGYPENRMPEDEVAKQNIVAYYSNVDKNAGALGGKCIEIRNPKTNMTLKALVGDTCSDSDCPQGESGCCTNSANSGSGHFIDIERYTASRLLGKQLKKDMSDFDLNEVDFRQISGPCYTGPGKVKA